MVWMLQEVVKSGTGVAARLPDQRPVAGKTGTSQSNRDLWFIGSIPQLTTGVWYGYDDERDTKQMSGEAAWTWKQFMLPIVATLPKQDFPPLPESMEQRMKRQEMQNLRTLPHDNQGSSPPPPTSPGRESAPRPRGATTPGSTGKSESPWDQWQSRVPTGEPCGVALYPTLSTTAVATGSGDQRI